jgi:hypothetical protein
VIKTSFLKFLMPLLVFLIAFICIPFAQLDNFSKIPGDIGDARLNNFFLENAFQFLVGNVDSIWHLSFFQPFPFVLGFSDNHFGTSPIYIIARLLSFDADTSFQLWFLFGYVANFIAAYYALRRLNGSVVASSIGALIFAFALPTSAHAGHAQLHYRFGLPLAIVFFADFLNTKRWRYFLIGGAWFVWQFYAGIYMGFFTLLLLVTMSLAYLGYALMRDRISVKNIYKEFVLTWCQQSSFQAANFFISLFLLLLLLFILFYPYLQVSHLYGAKRSWNEIAVMLPRPQSYFLSDASFLWSGASADLFSSIPMRHEHQMFIGGIPLILALAGFFIGSRYKNGPTFTLMSGMLGITIILTLYVGSFSLWYLLHKLPLVSAIRAMTRIDQAFLFPIAYFTVIAIDRVRITYAWVTGVIVLMILPLLITEASLTSIASSNKNSWRQRQLLIDEIVPKNINKDSILFFAQRSGPPYADEIDAMWFSFRNGYKTMNGYSGLYPPGYSYEYGDDCAELPKRVISYLKFRQQSENIAAYRELMSRIVPIGFKDCDLTWLQNPPSISSVDRVYSPLEFKALSFGSIEILTRGNIREARIVILNGSDQSFSRNSSIGKTIRVSWRFIGADGTPSSGWDTRKDLPLDIPPQGKLVMSIPINSSQIETAKAVQVSIVQEQVFWGHDVGVNPISVLLD